MRRSTRLVSAMSNSMSSINYSTTAVLEQPAADAHVSFCDSELLEALPLQPLAWEEDDEEDDEDFLDDEDDLDLGDEEDDDFLDDDDDEELDDEEELLEDE